MKLKSIEINGFKSFADKIRMDFEDNVTAIIGPNGSGKSNVSDAVRWVLGEQSAKMLRGSKMEDVIFSGTDDKSRRNSAQVTITFDNSSGLIPLDFKEISVSRKLYRSGESEYFLNKSHVRLKEIKELFLDTGIGKEGYSIISQGKIEEIVNGKADDRRAIFDEASGIAKIKYKKYESEKKLEKAKDNLIRLKDIILQNEDRYSFLKVQAEKARRARILTQNIEKIDFSQSYNHYNSLKEKISTLQISIMKKEEQLSLLNEKKVKIEEILAPYRETIDKLSEKLDNETREYDNFVRLNLDYKNKSDILIERNKNISLNIENLNNLISEMNKNISELNIQIEDKNNIIASKKEDSNILTSKKNVLKSEIEENREFLSNIIKKLEEFEAKKDDVTEKISNLEAEKKASELFNEQNLILQNENKLELEKLNLEKLELNKIVESEKEQIGDLFKELENLKKYITDLNSKKIELSKENLNNNNDIDLIKNEISFKQKEYDLINTHIRNYDGYNKSVQDLIKLSDKNVNIKKLILGTLGDLISVEERYRKAIDTVLSSNLQAIVVNNEEDAKFLIEQMKINKISRINFFPISKIKSTKVDNNVKDNDILSFANEVVSCEKNYREIVDYFLNKSIICENIEIAIKLSKKYKNKYRIITLDGDVINTWGSMSGGYKSSKNNFSILGRKEQLSKIKLELEELDEKLAVRNSNILKFKEELEKLEDIFNSESLNYTKLNSEYTEIKENLSKNQIKYSLLIENIEKISNSGENSVYFSEEKEEELVKLSKSLILIDEELNAILVDKQKYENTINDLERKEYMVNNDIDVLDRDINLILNSRYDLEENKNSISSRISFNKSEIEKYNSDFSQNNLDIEDYLKKYKESEIKIGGLKESSKNIREDLKKREEELRHSTENLNELKMNILTFEKDLETENSKFESNVNEHSNIISRLCEEYGINENQCELNMEKYKNETGTKAELKRLKQELKDIGSYSYDSIEEFEKVDGELKFQKEQEIDLNNAISDINSILKKLESEMRTVFTKEFEIINRNFSEIFSKLFNGGEARLELDGDNILTSGIEIIARPYGKKMQSLSLMSGGEKSLTAIALLFAIFETRPSPFCILDEIDASLDDSNIVRYTNYLKNFLDEVQFIMITHRKPTMEMANMIYGVTMEQKGISKIVSMKFDS